jgi:hypothetical protein
LAPFHSGGRASSPAGIAARQIRLELHRLGMPHARTLDDLALWKLHRKIAGAPNVPRDAVAGLAADALVKHPRPAWLERMVGPYPHFFENANPADIANPKEWGGGDPKGVGGQ